MSAVEVVDATKGYGRLRALDGVSLSIAPGQVLGLLGRNGAGKSRTCARGSATGA